MSSNASSQILSNKKPVIERQYTQTWSLSDGTWVHPYELPPFGSGIMRQETPQDTDFPDKLPYLAPVKLERQYTQTWSLPDGTWVHPTEPPPVGYEAPQTNKKTEENGKYDLREDQTFDQWLMERDYLESRSLSNNIPFANDSVIDNTDFTIPTPAHIRLEMSRNFCDNI